MAGLTPAPKLDINAVLEHYAVSTQHRGTYMTNCPLHEDATPSLSVNTDKQVWSCKSCGEGGDGYSLIMQKEQVDFSEALDRARTVGIGGVQVAEPERGSRYGGRRTGARKPGASGKRSGYVPPWRRT